MPSKYKTLWEEELKNKKFPDRYTGLLKIDYEAIGLGNDKIRKRQN